MRPMLVAKGARGGRNRIEIALDQRCVEGTGHFFVFFAGGFAGVFGAVVVVVVAVVVLVVVVDGVEFVSAPPSSSERLSSTSTVCVIASVPVGCGWGAAGAMVSVVAVVADSVRLHATAASAIAISTRMKRMVVIFTEVPLFARDAMRPVGLCNFGTIRRMSEHRRVGIFGWGLVAPKSPNIDAFEKNLNSAETWLEPFTGFGPSNFLVGYPDFDFETYHSWFDERFPPAKFGQLKDKMGPMVQYAIGSFIQSLTQNPGIEQYLQSLGTKCHVFVGTGLGEITITHEQALVYDRAQHRWNEFWAAPERCAALRAHREGTPDANAPRDPSEGTIGSEEWIETKYAWEEFWARKSDALQQYLAEAREIHGEPVPPSGGSASGSAKLSSIRQKLNRIRQLNKKWACPEEPWSAVSPNLLWNISNIPASQISMLGKIVGPAFAPVAACASFGIALKLAHDAIQLGEATACVIGMTDPPPHPMVLSAFYNANVVSADAEVSRPLTGLKGTHVAGGSCVWIVGDADVLRAKGFKPLGMEIVGVGTSSDAHHIITPSKGGPQLAIKAALDEVQASDVTTWDMHATATPGDATEIEHSLELLHRDVIFTARKGTFGHGMSVGGGWELTAQHLGMVRGHLYPVPLTEGELLADVALHAARFVDDRGAELNRGFTGKLSMGIGGINSCVISKPWENES